MAVVLAPNRLASLTHHGALFVAVTIGLSIPISTAFDSLLVVALVILWFASGRYAEKWSAVRTNPAVLLPTGLVALHILGSVYSVADSAALVRALDKASVLLLVPLLVSLKPDARIRAHALSAFSAAMMLTLVLSYAIWLGLVPGGGVIKGIPEDPSVFKMHITHSVLMAFTALLFAVRAGEPGCSAARVFYSLAALLAAANVLFLVHGRTGQLVLLALAVYFLIARLRWRGLLVALAGGAVFAAAIYALPSSALHERVRATIAEVDNWRAGKPAALRNMRLETWSNSLEIIRQNPIAGVGTGGFAAAYEGRVRGTPMLAVGQPENQYILTTAQLGLIGLSAVIAMFLVQWRLAARLATPSETELARGLVVAMAVGCLFNSFLLDHTEALFYAWLSGLLFAGLRPAASRG